jgi:hypothetical protein
VAEAICADLNGRSVEEEIIAGADAVSAVEFHHEDGTEAEHKAELLSLKLNPASEGAYTGFVRFDVAEDGEYVLSAGGGAITVLDASGTEMDVENAPAGCSGLDGGILLDLEPGEYVVPWLAWRRIPLLLLARQADAHQGAIPFLARPAQRGQVC